MPSIRHLSAIWYGPRRHAANNKPNLGGVTSIISNLLMLAHEEKSANPSSATFGDLGGCMLFIEYIHTTTGLGLCNDLLYDGAAVFDHGVCDNLSHLLLALLQATC